MLNCILWNDIFYKMTIVHWTCCICVCSVKDCFQICNYACARYMEGNKLNWIELNSIVRSLYFKIFSASFLIKFLSPVIATSSNIHVHFSLSWIIMSGLLLGIVLSVCTCWFHNMVTLPPWLVSTDLGTCSYHCFLSNFTPVSLHILLLFKF